MLLKKSFCTRDQNFFWLYTRLSCNDVGDQLPGDLGNVIEAIGLHRAIFYNRKIGAGQFGTFQQHRPSVVIRRSKIAQCSALPLRSCGLWKESARRCQYERGSAPARDTSKPAPCLAAAGTAGAPGCSTCWWRGRASYPSLLLSIKNHCCPQRPFELIRKW
jgi:hypothetical protein